MRVLLVSAAVGKRWGEGQEEALKKGRKNERRENRGKGTSPRLGGKSSSNHQFSGLKICR
jgi:hypothetical protein